jgi:hypothetical protein
MMREVFAFVQERRHVVEATAHVPEIAVYHSHDSIMGDRLQFFPDRKARRERSEAFEGISRMFMHHGRHYTALGRDLIAPPLAPVPAPDTGSHRAGRTDADKTAREAGNVSPAQVQPKAQERRPQSSRDNGRHTAGEGTRTLNNQLGRLEL